MAWQSEEHSLGAFRESLIIMSPLSHFTRLSSFGEVCDNMTGSYRPFFCGPARVGDSESSRDRFAGLAGVM